MTKKGQGVDPQADSKKNPNDEMLKRGTQDPTSVRAKNSGHGKKTADKWNQ